MSKVALTILLFPKIGEDVIPLKEKLYLFFFIVREEVGGIEKWPSVPIC